MPTQKEYLARIKTGNDFDLSIARGAWRSYRHVPVDGKVVLDIGAHIGTYSVLAALNGAKFVLAVEPLERNFRLLRANAKPFACIEPVNAAATLHGEEDHVWLRSDASAGKNTNFGHNTVERTCAGEGYSTVSTVSFKDILSEYRPFAIKMDCEGSEFDLLRIERFPKETRYVFGEIHFHRKEWRDAWPKIKARMAVQGFKISNARQSIIDGSTKLHGLLTWSRW